MESIVDQFAALLAQEEEPAKRKALLKRAELLAMKEVKPEVFEPPIKTLGEYLDVPIEVPPSLVWPTVAVRGEVTATLGRAGLGKTTLNLNRLLCWAAGLPLFDTFSDSEGKQYLCPDKPLRILIIENEGNAGMFHSKLGVMLNNGRELARETKDAIRDNLFIWGDGGYSGLKLDDPAILNQVRAGCEKFEPDILFIEPFRSLWRGEENSSTEMANIIDHLVAMATDYNCGVILSHHERKAGPGEDGELMSAGRGSTVLEGAAACMENFQKVKNGDQKELTWSKARYLLPPPPTRMEYDGIGWYRHVALDEIAGGVLRLLEENDDEPMSVKEISDELGETQTKLRPILSDLAKEEKVKKMKSTSDGGGSTGHRYRISTRDNTEHGGLAL